MSSNFDPDLFHHTKQLQLYSRQDYELFFINDFKGTSYVKQDINYHDFTFNTIHGNFFSSTQKEEMMSTKLRSEPSSRFVKTKFFEIYGTVKLKPAQDIMKENTIWYRLTFSEYLATFSALAISYMSIARFIMSNYNEYTQNEAMLSSLYGESSASERATSMRDVSSEQNYAVEAF